MIRRDHNAKGKIFKHFSRTFKYLSQTYLGAVLPRDERKCLMFPASHKISITDHSYTAGDGSAVFGVFCRNYCTVSSIQSSNMILLCTGLRSYVQ